MKVSTLNKEVCRGCKFPIITQNLVWLTVIAYDRCTVTLDRTSTNVMKGNKQVMEGYREQHTIL